MILLLLSIISFFGAFRQKKSKYPNNNTPIWKKEWSLEKFLWTLSILLFISYICLLLHKINKYQKTLTLFYIGFAFLLIHMIGQWFLKKCDFEQRRKNNTLLQYFVDNILGNLVVKPNAEYQQLCVEKKHIIVNRNVSIFFLVLFLLSFYIKLPFFGKTNFHIS